VLIGSFFFLNFFAGILFINFEAYKIKLFNPNLTSDQILFKKTIDMILLETP
jgi:hypothetical protein